MTLRSCGFLILGPRIGSSPTVLRRLPQRPDRRSTTMINTVFTQRIAQELGFIEYSVAILVRYNNVRILIINRGT